MSAYILDDVNFDVIIKSYVTIRPIQLGWNIWIKKEKLDLFHDTDRTYVGQILKIQNIASVDYRYKANTEMQDYLQKLDKKYIYNNRVNAVSPVALLKLLDCYDYQACETSDYKTTKACTIINQIREYTISRLPGYDEAAWGL